MHLFNPPEPTASPLSGGNPLIGRPGSPCGTCPLVPPRWKLTCASVTNPYSLMGSRDFVLQRDLAPIDLSVTKTTTLNSAAGNFTVPPGATLTQIELWGAGGGGGAGAFALAGGGGGGGAYCKLIQSVAAGTVIAYAVGAKGSGGTAGGDGSGGGDTTCTTYSLTAHGGGAGRGGNTTQAGGPGGTATGGSTNTSGGNGTAGAAGMHGVGGAAGQGGIGSGGDGGGISSAGRDGGAGQITFTYSVAVLQLATNQSCAWVAPVTIGVGVTGFWRLYYGTYAPNTGASGVSGWVACADMHENAPADVCAWGADATAATPPTPNWSGRNWNCLSSNTMQQIDGGLGFPSTVLVQPFWA